MTICIAAIGTNNKRKCIVLATDHMVSLTMQRSDLGGFEHSFTKYRQIDDNTVAMLAGNPLLFNELVKLKDGIETYDEKVIGILKNFTKIKRNDIRQQIYQKHDIPKKYFLEFLQSDGQNPIMKDIVEEIFDYKLDAIMMLVGYSEKGDPKITAISENGSEDWTDMHFHAIGSGSLQAMNTLMFQQHSDKDVAITTLYNVYKAKKNAEVAKGVGRKTDLLTFEPNSLSKISGAKLNILDEIYADELAFGKENNKLKTIFD